MGNKIRGFDKNFLNKPPPCKHQVGEWEDSGKGYHANCVKCGAYFHAEDLVSIGKCLKFIEGRHE